MRGSNGRKPRFVGLLSLLFLQRIGRPVQELRTQPATQGFVVADHSGIGCGKTEKHHHGGDKDLQTERGIALGVHPRKEKIDIRIMHKI